MSNNEITPDLFATEAFVVAPADAPFWYTSGLLGPYYINTHYLYGSKEEAAALLATIEGVCLPENRQAIGQTIGAATKKQYETNATYRRVIDKLVALAGTGRWDYVSGGERRDYFFSVEVARQLNLPHLYIFKDGDVRLADPVDALASKPVAATGNCLHVADLITKASSYERAWIPALQALGLTMTDTLAVVDREQGGNAILQAAGVRAQTLVSIDETLFADAVTRGLISPLQAEGLRHYGEDELAYVRAFLAAHPDFLAKEEARDLKTKERVQRLRKLL